MSNKEMNMHYLGEKYPGIYYTKREVECLLHLLGGQTIVSTASLLKLSPRTVEFYVKNMRMKIGVKTKSQLLKKMQEIEFKSHLSHLVSVDFAEV